MASAGDPYGVCTPQNSCQGNVITHYPSLEATNPGSAIYSVVFSEMEVTDSVMAERVHYWSTQDPTCPLVSSLMAIPQAFQGAQRWAILFDGGLWGLSLGCGGACTTKKSHAKRLPRDGGDAAVCGCVWGAEVRGRRLWVQQSRAWIQGWKKESGVEFVRVVLVVGVDTSTY